MSFFSWFLRATLVLSFVLGAGAHAGPAFDRTPVAAQGTALAAQSLQQVHCDDEQAPDHSVHDMAATHAAAGGASHDASSDCCKVMSDCHCTGSHSASCVASAAAQARDVQRQEDTLFSHSAYGSPALALSIKPPIA